MVRSLVGATIGRRNIQRQIVAHLCHISRAFRPRATTDHSTDSSTNDSLPSRTAVLRPRV
jgi:hypothetical protein